MRWHRNLLLNAAWMLVVGVLQRGMGLVGITLLARILDPGGLGVYAFAQSTGQTCYGLVRLGADAGLHVGMAKLTLPDEKIKAEALIGEGLAVFLGIAVVGAGVLLLLAETIANSLFAAPELTPFVAASAVFFVAQVASQYSYTCLAGMHAFVEYARMMTVTSVLVPFFGASGGAVFGVVGAVWGAAMASALTALALATLLVRELMHRGLRMLLIWPSRQAAGLLAVGVPFYAGGLILTPVDFMTMGLLSKVVGLSALGELRATQALMSVATMLPVAMSGPLISYVVARTNVDTGPDAALVQIKAVWVFSIGIAISLATVWPFAMVMIFGRGFVLAQSVGMLALIGLVPMMLLSVLTGALLAMRRSIVIFAVGGVQALCLGLFATALIADHGLAGLLVAQAVGMFAGVVVAMAGFAWQFDVPFFRSWMVPLSILTVVLIGLLAADAVIAEAVFVRLLVGVGLMSALVLVVAKFVVSKEESVSVAQLMIPVQLRVAGFLGAIRKPR